MIDFETRTYLGTLWVLFSTKPVGTLQQIDRPYPLRARVVIQSFRHPATCSARPVACADSWPDASSMIIRSFPNARFATSPLGHSWAKCGPAAGGQAKCGPPNGHGAFAQLRHRTRSHAERQPTTFPDTARCVGAHEWRWQAAVGRPLTDPIKTRP